MTGLEIGIVSVLGILLLVVLGMYIPVVLAVVSLLGAWFISGNFNIAIFLLTQKTVETISSQEFAVIPLFVLMGLLISISDIARETFGVANYVFRKIAGGLGIATVAANAVFASITGVSVASAAVFTKVAVPEMLRFGYHPRLAVGIVAGSSILGMLIPPSILLIVYAFIAEVSVGSLFLAAVIPGLLLALFYVLAIAAVGRFRPDWVGRNAAATASDAEDMNLAKAVRLLAPIVALVALVIGGIYTGLFTPTESGAVGAAGALLLTLARRRLSWSTFWRVAVETGHVTASICFMIIAASMYSSMLGLSGVPTELQNWVVSSGFDLVALICVYVLIVILLGTLLDSVSIILIVLPIFIPLLQHFQIDLIWFGILSIIVVEIGLLTPPLGFAVFVVKSCLSDDRIKLKDVFMGALPFGLIMLLVVVLISVFPGLIIH
ncbi:TRAP transporter large permease [Roseibium sp. MMSF_3544]|uniref:TRAP transporter large permease n=1 Tax=unclassified Roseibium TaxID=2629323 RepID=UPI00273F8323|nr:TRAP transporter large permease [Roseibium sp. MMSF_3544]